MTLTMPDPKTLDQLHPEDAQRGWWMSQLDELNSPPTCDIHRQIHHVEVAATSQFRCRGCRSVEYRCEDCTDWWLQHRHVVVECMACHREGYAHKVFGIYALGSRS